MKPDEPTKEALYLDSLLESATSKGETLAAIAKSAGLKPPWLYQWRTSVRPVPWSRAEALAMVLGCDPAKISAEYAEVQINTGSAKPLPDTKDTDKRRPDLAMARVENDVDALRFALAGMVAVMVQHRPAEARDVASTIRKSVPTKFVNRGFLHELLKALEKAGKA